jgi:hypothetical protein
MAAVRRSRRGRMSGYDIDMAFSPILGGGWGGRMANGT